MTIDILSPEFDRRIAAQRKEFDACAGPDLLAYVNEIELGDFYMSLEAVREAGKRYIDAEIEAQEKRNKGSKA